MAAKLPRRIQKDCLDHAKRVIYAANLPQAQERFREWKQAWGAVAPGAVECLEKDLDAVLRFFTMPEQHWKAVRTTNIIERAFKGFRRCTRQMDSLPNEDCCLRCVYAIAMNLNESWKTRKLRGFGQKAARQATQQEAS